MYLVTPPYPTSLTLQKLRKYCKPQ
jgi:hypothetical protein